MQVLQVYLLISEFCIFGSSANTGLVSVLFLQHFVFLLKNNAGFDDSDETNFQRVVKSATKRVQKFTKFAEIKHNNF